MRRGNRGDEGASHVLEAVIIATIMVCSVVYVATFEQPVSSGQSPRTQLSTAALDALNILADTPASAGGPGENLLSRYIAECMGGDCDNLTEKLDTLLPEGTSYSLSISNGYETYPIYERRSPPGEAVTVGHLLEPQWSHTFGATGLSLGNPTSDPVVAYTLPVYSSNTLDQGGSPLRILVHGERRSDGSNFTLSAAYSTQAVATIDAQKWPAASLTFVNETGEPMGALDVSNVTVSSGAATLRNLNMRLRVSETANVTIPAGAELRVALPRAWNASASDALNPGWSLTSRSSDATGSQATSELVAKTNASITNGHLDFVFNTTYRGDLVEDYLLHATVSKGALAEANLVVHADSKTSNPYAWPVVVASVPRPMGATAQTNWTLGLSIPSAKGSATHLASTDTVDVTSIEIIEQDGREIFGGVSLASGPGSISVSGDRMIWRGSWASTDGLLNLTFHVTPSGVASPELSRAAFEPPTTLGGWTGRMTQQVGTGFYRDYVLPTTSSYSGYDTSGATVTQTNHTAYSNGTYHATLLPGSYNYTVANVSSIASSVQGSYAGVERRNVAVGDTAIIDVDVQSLVFALASAGQRAGITLNVYPPWANGTRVPLATTSSFDTGLGSSDVTAMTALDVNDDGYADPILGTSNGRVLALHALTGGRIEGDVFTAPTSRTGGGTTSPQITQLGLVTLGGTQYIVAATDQGSAFVLDKHLNLTWDWYQVETLANLAIKIVAMDTASDVDGDGRADIVLGLQPRDTTTAGGTGLVYVLRALPGNTALVAYRGDGVDGPFDTPVGTPSAVLGLGRIGQDAVAGGVATTFQYVAGVAGVSTDVTSAEPGTPTVSLPRAGLRGIAVNGTNPWTFFGSPVTTARGYDYDGDNMTDIVGGSPAGYVFMLDGRTPTAPLPSTLVVPGLETLDSSTHDAAHTVILTSDGSLYYTTDGWVSSLCVGCDPSASVYAVWPTARAVAANGSSSFWVGGLANGLWRSLSPTDVATAKAVVMDAVTPVATRNGSSFVWGTSSWDITDLEFGWGSTANEGWAIGQTSGCSSNAALCQESLLMRTTDGGVHWTILSKDDATLLPASGTTVTVPLHRIHLRDDTAHPGTRAGFVVGDNGTLLTTTDSGAHWVGQSVLGTHANLRDVACSPSDANACIVVAEGGYAFATTNALTFPATWTNLTSAVFNGKDLYSVGLLNASVGYVGSKNAVFKTYDGGHNWTALPMNYIEANGDRVDVLADGTGFIYGGSSAHERTFYLGRYATESRAQTVNLGGSVPSGAHVAIVDLEASIARIEPNATVSFSVSADGGHTWTPFVANTTTVPAPFPRSLLGERDFLYPKETTHAETGGEVYDYVLGLTAVVDDQQGSDLRVRMDFANSGDYTHMSAWVHSARVNVTYANDTDILGAYSHNLTDADADATNTTAKWEMSSGGIRAPQIDQYWARNVSGSVQDVVIGSNVSGDSHKEVYVATGAVVAENSPDSVIYAGTDASRAWYPDDRVYLLDGKNGSIIAQTASFAGPVTHLSAGDANADGVTDYVYATVWDGATGTLVALDPATLAVRWTKDVTTTEPSALVTSAISGPNSTAIVSSRLDTSSARSLSGETQAYLGYDSSQAWRSIPDQQGHYTVNLPVNRSWMFGPYVVEVGVDWNTTATDLVSGVYTPETVVQTARFYDYFLVTPPDALSPPSPIYNVQMTAWYEDWR